MASEPKSKPSFTPRRKWGVGFDVVVRTLVVIAVLGFIFSVTLDEIEHLLIPWKRRG